MEAIIRSGVKCFRCGKELEPHFKDSGIFCWSGILSVNYPSRDCSPYFNDIVLCDRCHEEVLDAISELVETKPNAEAE